MRNRSVERAPLSTTKEVEGSRKRWTARNETTGWGRSEREEGRKVRIATTLYDVEGRGGMCENGEIVFEVEKFETRRSRKRD